MTTTHFVLSNTWCGIVSGMFKTSLITWPASCKRSSCFRVSFVSANAVDAIKSIAIKTPYTFKLLDSQSDRHIVQIWDADGSHLIATVLAINNVRLKPTGKTVVKFAERSGDNPEALKAWFYPGDNSGQERS